jgi:4'-phosphopantetheinyl transferase
MTPLATGEVHVWTARRVCGPTSLKAYEEILNFTEHDHARKFRFRQHRERYIFAHGILRRILALYLQCPPQQIAFDQNEFGKPSLCDTQRWLTFNLSKSEDLVVLAITKNQSIGVDIERIRYVRGIDAMARYYFTERERFLLEAAPPEERDRIFHTWWTRKEAYVKAVGRGLSIDLTSVDVAILGQGLDAGNIDGWCLSDLVMPSGYIGALAVEGEKPVIEYMEWCDDNIAP